MIERCKEAGFWEARFPVSFFFSRRPTLTKIRLLGGFHISSEFLQVCKMTAHYNVIARQHCKTVTPITQMETVFHYINGVHREVVHHDY